MYVYDSTNGRNYSRRKLIKLFRYYLRLLRSRYGRTVELQIGSVSNDVFIAAVIKQAKSGYDTDNPTLYPKFERICNLLKDFGGNDEATINKLFEKVDSIDYEPKPAQH